MKDTQKTSISTEALEAARAASYWLRVPGGLHAELSLKEIVSAATLRRVRDLERWYNDGRPFDPLPVQRLPRGRIRGR